MFSLRIAGFFLILILISISCQAEGVDTSWTLDELRNAYYEALKPLGFGQYGVEVPLKSQSGYVTTVGVKRLGELLEQAEKEAGVVPHSYKVYPTADMAWTLGELRKAYSESRDGDDIVAPSHEQPGYVRLFFRSTVKDLIAQVERAARKQTPEKPENAAPEAKPTVAAPSAEHTAKAKGEGRTVDTGKPTKSRDEKVLEIKQKTGISLGTSTVLDELTSEMLDEVLQFLSDPKVTALGIASVNFSFSDDRKEHSLSYSYDKGAISFGVANKQSFTKKDMLALLEKASVSPLQPLHEKKRELNKKIAEVEAHLKVRLEYEEGSSYGLSDDQVRQALEKLIQLPAQTTPVSAWRGLQLTKYHTNNYTLGSSAQLDINHPEKFLDVVKSIPSEETARRERDEFNSLARRITQTLGSGTPYYYSDSSFTASEMKVVQDALYAKLSTGKSIKGARGIYLTHPVGRVEKDDKKTRVMTYDGKPFLWIHPGATAEEIEKYFD